MNPDQIKEARKTLNLTLAQLATMLGYQGVQRRQMMYDIETGRKPLREPQRRLLVAYLEGYRPQDWGKTYDLETD